LELRPPQTAQEIMNMESYSTKPLALVTGASSGIGYEIAKQFAQHGFDLIVAAEDTGIADAARQLEQLGVTAEPVQVDLTAETGVETLYDVIRSRGRPLDAAAINAGVGVGGPFLSTELSEELKLIQLNVVSTVRLAKRVLPDMTARGKGRLLFTSSVAGIMPTPFEAVYGASKAFVLSFAASLNDELRDSGVTITSLLPGPTETNFFHRAGLDDTSVGRSKKDDPGLVARQAFQALMAGEERVQAGSIKTRLLGAASRFMPEGLKARLHHQMAKPRPAQHH
jgi:short-subunit dehydrogenase